MTGSAALIRIIKGQIYGRLERALMNSTDLFLFESAFARDTYQRMIGTPKGLVRWYAGCCKTPIGNTLATAVVAKWEGERADLGELEAALMPKPA